MVGSMWEKKNSYFSVFFIFDPVILRRKQSSRDRVRKKDSVWQRKQSKFKEHGGVCVICLDLSRLVGKVTGCEGSKFLSGVRRMEAEAGSYQDSGFASIKVSPGCLCSSYPSVNTAIFALPLCNFPIWFISTTYCFICDVFPACGTKRTKLKKSLSWIIKSSSLKRNNAAFLKGKVQRTSKEA